MKHIRNKKSLDLGKPLFDVEEPSPVMQFFFYFPLVLLGVGSSYGFFYTAFSIKLSLVPLIWCGVLFSAALPIFFLSSRFQALLLSISMVTWGGVLIVFRNKFYDGLVLTVNAVIESYSKKSGFTFATLPTEVTRFTQTLQANTVFAVFMLYPVVFLMSYFLIQRKRFFPIFVLTLPFVGVPLAYTIVPDEIAAFAMLLFWTLLVFLAPSLCVPKRIRQKNHRIICHGTSVINPGTFLTIILLAGFIGFMAHQVPSKGYVRSAEVNGLRKNLVTMPQIQPLFRNDKIIGQTNVDLTELGNRRYTRKPVLKVKAKNSDLVYLKGYVGSIYTGHSWESFSKQTSNRLTKLLNGEKVQNFPARFEELISQHDLSDLERDTIAIQNIDAAVRGIYVPSGLISTPDDLSSKISFIDDGHLSVPGLFDSVEEYEIDMFNHRAIYSSDWFLSERLRSVETITEEQKTFLNTAEAYSKFVREEYTQLPTNVKKILDQYRQENGLVLPDSMDLEYGQERYELDLAIGIISRLDRGNTYTLSPGKTPPGRDFLDYFLNENKLGYCVHFATAATGLLRSAGIPARYVEGYVLEPTDAGREKDWRDILDSSAHAWVEIYMDGLGWIELEATPSSAFGATEGAENRNERFQQVEQPEEAEAEQEEETPTAPPEQEEPEPITPPQEEENPQDQTETQEKQDANTSPVLDEKSFTDLMQKGIAAGVLVLGCALLGMWGRRKYRLAQYQKLISQENQNKVALAVYQRILDLEKQSNSIPDFSQQIPEALHEIAMKARFSQHDLSQEELSVLFEYEILFKNSVTEKLTRRQYFIWKYIHNLL